MQYNPTLSLYMIKKQKKSDLSLIFKYILFVIPEKL